ncbi:flagellar export chaperone FliS [Paenibacillus alkalitolerans]|uniref:flagellar export chaperone FliS n=1 Tax=Paenibacillus alkalitolerans TaxID=2799335 RepID=UPI0018F7905F|nr:flagellar export chaperone FliS [Paenibacillus alkalitolerans]
MLQAQRNKYLETTIQTASPAQLLIMLYDGAIRFSKMSIEALNQRQMEEANRNLLKVQDIIREFMVTLDQTSPVSEGLMRLYEYFLQRLMEANMKKEVEPIQEVLGYLVDLKETWIQAAKHASQVASHS